MILLIEVRNDVFRGIIFFYGKRLKTKGKNMDEVCCLLPVVCRLLKEPKRTFENLIAFVKFAVLNKMYNR